MSTENLTATEISILVKSSQGKPKLRISVPSTFLWEDLRAKLVKEGYNMDGLEAVNSFNNLSFNHPKGKLPDQDFNLFLFPRETKGGMGLSRAEVYTKVKGYIALGTKAEAFFNEGKNYTTKKTDELEALIAKWEKKHGTAVGDVTVADKKSKATVKPSQTKALTPKAPRVKAAAKTTNVTSVAEAKAVPCPEAPATTLESTLSFLRGITGHENQEHINAAAKSVELALKPKPTKSEDEILAEEEAFLKSGLRGIKR